MGWSHDDPFRMILTGEYVFRHKSFTNRWAIPLTSSSIPFTRSVHTHMNVSNILCTFSLDFLLLRMKYFVWINLRRVGYQYWSTISINIAESCTRTKKHRAFCLSLRKKNSIVPQFICILFILSQLIVMVHCSSIVSKNFSFMTSKWQVRWYPLQNVKRCGDTPYKRYRYPLQNVQHCYLFHKIRFTQYYEVVMQYAINCFFLLYSQMAAEQPTSCDRISVLAMPEYEGDTCWLAQEIIVLSIFYSQWHYISLSCTAYATTCIYKGLEASDAFRLIKTKRNRGSADSAKKNR